jgi:hypothetical protein
LKNDTSRRNALHAKQNQHPIGSDKESQTHSGYDASRGLVDADLGGGVVKQRIARQGGGKSGGFRTIILFRIGERAFFVHGFAKNEQDNVRDDELAAFKLLAAEMLAYDDAALAKAIANGTLTEVVCND